MKTRSSRKFVFVLLWILAFALVNYPIGAWASVRLEPFILGMPFSVFYFWCAYSLLVLAGVLLAWKVMRD